MLHASNHRYGTLIKKISSKYILDYFILKSISPTIYKQLLRQFPFPKKLQTQTVSTEKLQKALLYKKAACKMMVKLTPGVGSFYMETFYLQFCVSTIERKLSKGFFMNLSLSYQYRIPSLFARLRYWEIMIFEYQNLHFWLKLGLNYVFYLVICCSSFFLVRE